MRRWTLFVCFVGLLLFSIDCGEPSPSKNQEVQADSAVGGTEDGGQQTQETSTPVPDRKIPEPASPKQSPVHEEASTTPEEPSTPEPSAPDPGTPIPDKTTPPPDRRTPPPDRTTPVPDKNPVPDVDKKWLAQVSCMSTPPKGAKLAAAPPKYTGGTCPKLKEGYNTIVSKKNKRKFLLVLPKNPKPNERFPVLFLWHWLKASANSFYTKGDIKKSVDQQRFIAIIPEKKGDLSMLVVKVPWPFLTIVPQQRFEEEFTFFDDMLSCVSQQFKVNKECVASAGVSAGALFTAQLASARSQYLSSFISLSGGTNVSAGVVAKVSPWKSTAHKLPALVLWGGSQDSCVLLNFEQGSKDLENNLQKDGHFFIECIHNCKHSEPPITARPGKSRYEPLWDFFLKHPFWLKAGTSPFQVIPWSYPNVPWCSVGKGGTKIRTGKCPPPGCPI